MINKPCKSTDASANRQANEAVLTVDELNAVSAGISNDLRKSGSTTGASGKGYLVFAFQ